jgi:chorismate mutase
MIRGIRGAVCATTNSREAIFEATRNLLKQLLEQNEIVPERIASIFLTATPDLTADYPAYAAREMGLAQIPLMCASEINVPGALPRVIRVLIHVDTDRKQKEVRHLYLGEAARLRPDLAAVGGL